MFMTSGKVQDHLEQKEGAVTADLSAAAADSAWHDAADFRELYALVHATMDAGGDLTLQFRQATDAAGTGAKNLGTAVVKTLGAAAEGLIAASQLVEEMDEANGFTFVGARISTDDAGAGTVPAAVAFAAAKRRFKP